MSQATIERFYAAFAQLDADTMQGCCAGNAQFDHEAFSLQGQKQIGSMWRMLCSTTKAKGLAHWQLDVSDITTNSAHWEAHYLFSATGRLVHNRIDARFEFDPQGHITRHRDRFDFWAWSRQALGAPGLLMGWSPWLRAQVRAKAAAGLQAFQAARG